jgi:hypothetical protein
MNNNQIDEEMTYEEFLFLQQALNDWDSMPNNMIRVKKEVNSVHLYLSIEI